MDPSSISSSKTQFALGVVSVYIERELIACVILMVCFYFIYLMNSWSNDIGLLNLEGFQIELVISIVRAGRTRNYI